MMKTHFLTHSFKHTKIYYEFDPRYLFNESLS